MRFIPTVALVAGLAGFGGLTLPAVAQTAVASGQFADVSTRYQASGSAVIAQANDGRTVLQLTNFSVTPGPDLEVWLVADANPGSSSEVLASEWVSLGLLQSPNGDQAYEISSDIDISDYGSVVIWCEDFSVLFSVATLR